MPVQVSCVVWQWLAEKHLPVEHQRLDHKQPVAFPAGAVDTNALQCEPHCAAEPEQLSHVMCTSFSPVPCPQQELSTLMRYGVNPIVLLSNNGSYTIESEIHDGWAVW